MYSEADKELLRPYVTNLTDSVYCLYGLPPEVLAVLFAYVSRSPRTFRENLLQLLKDRELAVLGTTPPAPPAVSRRAREFHEKWVIGYGHGSVAEHADLKFALEDISIIATKVVEDMRLAAFTEKSTRYQHFSSARFYFDPAVDASPHGQQVRKLVADLFAFYHEARGPVSRVLQTRAEEMGVAPGKGRERALHAATLDVIRYLLPAGTLTSLGLSINARSAAHLISKLLSHPLRELQRLGERMLEEGRKITPTLLRHAAPREFLRREEEFSRGGAGGQDFPPGPEIKAAPNTVELLDYDPRGEEKVLAGLLYPGGQRSFGEVLKTVAALAPEKRGAELERLLRFRGEHDRAPRAFELTEYTMELVLDYGAFRDVQRHRLATQLNPWPTVVHGYAEPPEFAAAGLEKRYRQLLERSAELYFRVAVDFPREASYLVPLAFRKRVLFRWNLREVFHFVELRSAPQGHSSYRYVAQEIFRAVEKVHPHLARHLRVDLHDYFLGRLAAES